MSSLKHAVMVSLWVAACQGPPGPMGSPGAMGAMGVQGPPGDAGPPGEAGSMGARGETGPAGPAGPTGPAGPMGAEGPAGPAGPAGAMGPMGVAGPAGSVGAMGPAGPAGAGADPSYTFSLTVDRGSGRQAPSLDWSDVTSLASALGRASGGLAQRSDNVNLTFYLADGSAWLIQCSFGLLSNRTFAAASPFCTINGTRADGMAFQSTPGTAVTTGASIVTLTDTAYEVRIARVSASLQLNAGGASAGAAVVENIVINYSRPRGGVIAVPRAYRAP